MIEESLRSPVQQPLPQSRPVARHLPSLAQTRPPLSRWQSMSS